MAGRLGGADTRNVSLDQLVHECMNEILSEPDYSKQLDIVEKVQAFGQAYLPARCKEVAASISKLMEKKKKNENVVYLGFHLADFCLKNIHPQMGHVMAQENFQKMIIKLAKSKAVKGRAWVLMVCKVQEWSYLFQNLKGFQESYIAMQKMGVEFPPPSRELMEEQSKMNERRIDRMNERKKKEKQANDPLRKLKESLTLLQENVNLVIEMIGAVDPAKEDVRRNELLVPLLESIGKQRPKIAELIGTMEDEDVMLLLLDVNDRVNNAFKWYQDLVNGVKPDIPSSTPQSPDHHDDSSSVIEGSVISPPPSHAPPTAISSPPSHAPPTNISSPPSHAPPTNAPPVDNDPFAALARARKEKERRSGAQRGSGVVHSNVDSLIDLGGNNNNNNNVEHPTSGGLLDINMIPTTNVQHPPVYDPPLDMYYRNNNNNNNLPPSQAPPTIYGIQTPSQPSPITTTTIQSPPSQPPPMNYATTTATTTTATGIPNYGTTQNYGTQPFTSPSQPTQPFTGSSSNVPALSNPYQSSSTNIQNEPLNPFLLAPSTTTTTTTTTPTPFDSLLQSPYIPQPVQYNGAGGAASSSSSNITNNMYQTPQNQNY